MAIRKGTNANNSLRGTSVADVLMGLAGADVLFGGSGNDLVLGGSGNDKCNGDAGDDTIDGGTGRDTMTGGLGNDVFIVDVTTDSVSDTGGTDTVQSSVTYTLGSTIENLMLLGSGNINGTGNALDNILTGNSGNNLLDGGTGADTMAGGAGNDIYTVDSTSDSVSDSAGFDIVNASATFTIGSGIEVLNLIGSGNINGTGNNLANTITGNAGNNSINGGAGADTMAGGAGDDIYTVNTSTDVVNEEADEGTDEVRSLGAYYALAAGSEIERLTYIGGGHFTGVGNEYDNAITGGSGEDNLFGGVGRDTLTGGAGLDGLDGGLGSDTYVFNDGDVPAGEVIADSGLAGIDTLRLGTLAGAVDFRNATAITGIEALTFTGSQSAAFNASQFGAGLISSSFIVDGGSSIPTLTISGASSFTGAAWTLSNWDFGTVQIFGTSGADSIVGTSAVDLIRGGGGADTVDGGGGDDYYLFYFSDLVPGDTISDTGGTAGDRIALFGAAFDFTTASFSGIERVTLSGSTATFNAGQITGAMDFSTPGGGANIVTLNNAAGYNGTALTFSIWNPAADIFAINGTAGGDGITGTSVGDTIRGFAGADTLDGGAGNDVYVYAANADQNPGDVISDSGGSGSDVIRVTSGAGIALHFMFFSGIEGIELRDDLTSAIMQASQLTSTFTVDGDTGDQFLLVRVNTASFSAANWTFTDWNFTDDTWLIRIDQVTGATVTGSAFNDRIIGFVGDDTILGGGGEDTLSGYSGVDSLDGGAGNDTYRVGGHEDGVTQFGDIIADSGAPSDVDTLEITGSGSVTLFGVTVTGIEALRFADPAASLISYWQPDADLHVIGAGAGNQINLQALTNYDASGWTFENWTTNMAVFLVGDAANNQLIGSSERDGFFGQAGADTMTGGGGADRFTLFPAHSGIGAGNRDVITDFVQGTDKIHASDLGIGTEVFIGTDTFLANPTGHIRYYFDGGNTIVEIDRDNNNVVEQEYQLTGNISLLESDFILA